MDDQALCVSDVGKMGKQLKRLDKPQAVFATPRQVETEYGAATFGQVFADQRQVAAALEPGLADLADVVSSLKILGDRLCVGDVLSHA